MAGYRIRVEGGGLNYDEEVPRSVALEIIDRAESAQEGEASEPSGEAAHPIQEWMKRARPSNHPERITVVAAYVEDELGEEGVHYQDIREWFERAGEDPPVNLGRDLRMALERGLVEDLDPEADDITEKHFAPTARGKEEVEGV